MCCTCCLCDLSEENTICCTCCLCDLSDENTMWCNEKQFSESQLYVCTVYISPSLIRAPLKQAKVAL